MNTVTAPRALVLSPDEGAFDIRRRQEVWDRFFEEALAGFDDPNPDLRRDRALDKTIRALGHRPRPPLTEKERYDLEVQRDVAAILRDSARARCNDDLIERELLREMRIYWPADDELSCND